MKQWDDTSNNLHTTLTENMHQLEQKMGDLNKLVYQAHMEQCEILNSLQELQRGMIVIMQHYDIKLSAPLGFDSNPIWIEDEEMDS